MHHSQIIDITPEFLTYKNDQGKSASISFKECAKNYRNHMICSGEFGESLKVAPEDEFKVIGWRDAFASPRYIEIFSDPRLRIEFPKSWRLWKPYKNFAEVHSQIIGAGWRTLDLG